MKNVKLPLEPTDIKGFLDSAEGAALHDLALERAPFGPCLEIGAYCGKSALYLGAAAQEAGGVLFSVDHHRGSEENQPGWEWHDADLWDAAAGAMDSLPAFRRTLRAAGLEETVIALVGRSKTVAAHWRTPLSFLFIDGGHTMEHALNDYRLWTPHVMAGGVIAIHDVFPNPEDGGRPPYEIYKLALASGLYEDLGMVKSLARLRRL
ncbi:MAG: class I SAM-dependent methyltransferase [Pseudomonadota bacterium]